VSFEKSVEGSGRLSLSKNKGRTTCVAALFQDTPVVALREWKTVCFLTVERRRLGLTGAGVFFFTIFFLHPRFRDGCTALSLLAAPLQVVRRGRPKTC
jgi:hypothetical protein